MKKRILRFLTLTLAILTVFTLIVSCSPKSELTDERITAENVETEEDPVPCLDWGGRAFRVLATHNEWEPNFEIVGDLGGGRLSAKVYERNALIYEYCNVEVQDVAGDESSFSYLEKDLMSGTQSYDLVFLVRDDMTSAIKRGFMKDLTQINYVNFANDWYSELAIESMKISGRLYHMTSDFSLVDKARTNTLFFNRDLAATLHLDDVVSMVRKGTWTVEIMYQMAVKAALDDGDNVVEKTDRYGFAGGGSEASLALYAGMGNTLVSLDSNNNYEIKILQDRSLKGLDRIKDMLDIDQWIGFTGSEAKMWTKDYNLPNEAFCDGRVLFLSTVMGSIDTFATEADFAYTAITYPKYDVEQERYYTTNDNMYCSTFGVPFAAEDMDFSGYMIEVLSWMSNTTTYPEYYQIRCQVQKAYDSDCAEMLRLNYEGLIFDFGCLYSDSIKYKKQIEIFTTDRSNTKNIATLLAGTEISSNKAIDSILNTVTNLPQ